MSNLSADNKNDIWIYGALIVFSAMAALLAVYNIKISPDSMRFGLVSQQILAGNGIKVPIIRLEDSYVPVNGAVPFLDQTPLLPVLYAVMGGVMPQNLLPAQILNLIAHVAVAFFTYLVMKIMCDRRIALLTGITVSFSYPLLRLTHHAWSEPVFIALITAVMYFISLSRQPGRNTYRRDLCIAGICAGAAILARNAGIAVIPVFIWEAFRWRKRGERSMYRTAVLACTIPVMTTAGLFGRNFILSGSLRGFHQVSPDRSYAEAFTGTIHMIFEQFQLGQRTGFLIIFLLSMAFIYIVMNSESRKGVRNLLDRGMDSIVIFMLSYTTLIVLTMAEQQWRFEVRYMAPLVPFLFIMVIRIFVSASERISSGGFRRLSLAGIVFALGIITAGNFYKTYLNVPEFLYKQEKAYSILHSCTYKWIRENFGKDTTIVTNRPYHLSFFGGYTTVALPHKRFNPTIPVPDNMESLLLVNMSRFGAQFLALFESVDEKYDGKYIANLFRKPAKSDVFDLVYECPGGIVYKVKTP